MTQQDLGRRLGIDRTSITAVIDELEHRKYVRRQPDPNDRRAYNVVLTEPGSQALNALEPRVGVAMRRV